MQNAYISSSIYCFRTKGSVYNEYSYLLNERIDRNPIRASSLLTSTPCCCACCAFPTHRDRVVPINPCYLYGLRQSALLQRSASRKLILGGRDRFVYRIQESGLGRDWYELACSVSERSGYNRRGRRGNVKCGCCVDERGESEVYDSGGLSDVEAVLSLLSEEVGDECFGRERNRVLLKRAEAERKKGSRGTRRNVGLIKRVEEESRRRSNSGSKTNVSSSNRVEGERRSFGGREKTQSSVTGRETVESSSKGVQVDFERDNRREWNSGEKSNGRYSSLESNTNHRLESARIELCKSDSREKEETRVLLRGENLRGRKEGSSSSSYYSVSSSGDFGSEADVQDKHGFMDEPGCSGYRDSEYDRGGRVDGRVSEEYRIHRDDAVDHKEISKQRNTSVEGVATWDCKKESERKLTEVVTEEAHASRKSSEMHSRILKTNESELPKTSGSQKQLDDVRENLYLTQRTKERYSQRRNHDGGETESRRRFQEGKAKLGSHRTDVETTVQSQKRLSEREESVSMATNVVQEKKVEHDKTGREDLNRDTQKLSRVSQVQVVDTGGTSNWPRQSDARRINQEEYAYVGMSSVEGSEEQYHQIGHQIDHKALQRVRLRKGTSDVAEMSLIHATDTAKNTNSQRAFDKRITNEESITVSAATSAVEAIQRNTQTDEKLMEVKSRKEAQSSLKVSTFEEKEWGEPSRSTASSMVSQARMQRENVEVYKGRTLVPLLPPPPLLIARGSVRIESSSETTAHDVSGETSESNSALNYESCGGNSNTETQGEILYYTTEDALGSAHRQEESSSQLAGEFFEKVRQEVSTSKNQTQEQGSATVSEDKWVRGGEDGQRIASQYGSEDSQLKRNESRRSSGGSGTKGPSVEMWAVTDTSTLKSPKDEKAEDTTTGEKSEATITSEKVEATTTTGNAVAKRSGRSIWNIVADIVKLRWNPRAETDRPASKSGERVSSIASASSEAWFSGHQTEEKSKKNVERDKTMQPETSSDQLQPAKSFPQSEQVSGKMKSKDKVVYLEAGMLASLNKEGSGLTSTLVSLTSGEETFSPKDNQQKVRGSSGVQIVDSSQPLIASGVESPVLKESSNAGYSASVSGSLEDTDQFSHQKFDDMSDNSENSGELKQRRLQRNRQVLKNRFSQPLIASSVKSPVVEEISGAGYTTSGSGSLEHMDQFGCHKLDEMTDNAQASGELKQRRLQMNKQVPKDRFDEWEEAHNVDFEQRKTDEYFMREALLEAKKAADTWEVPVGAVLVQQGKIIARGYNLVEELRDSTAHAEMICIREASNVLRTWRLAESTLYVTLEPCPMCAGAIFQARVDTVVWGAPNKLLGADGSWIRLFPDGSKGNDLEPSDKPAAPVHPFHPNITIRRGVLASECADIMQQFFQLRRKKKEKRLAEPPASTSTAVSHHPSKLLTKVHDIFHMMFCL